MYVLSNTRRQRRSGGHSLNIGAPGGPTMAWSMAMTKVPIMDRMMNAGIAAMAHLTMKVTMDMNGILMSVTTTRLS